MNVIDCFPYFNETDVLELRLNELDRHVSRFCIAEADETHAGKYKGFNFWENLDRLNVSDHIKSKIRYQEVRFSELDLPKNNRVIRENMQRQALNESIMIDDVHNLVMISDCDEIPNLLTWNGREGVFRGDAYFYKMNLLHNVPWNGTIIVQGWRFFGRFGAVDMQSLRNVRDILPPVGYGQHFSWMSDPYVKVQAFAHDELDTPDFRADKSIHPGDKTALMPVPIDSRFPVYLRENQARFTHLLEECRP